MSWGGSTKRDVVKRGEAIFEIVYVTENDAKDFYNANKDNCVRTWESARVLYDQDGSATRLKDLAQTIKREGKDKLDVDTVAHLHFDANDQLHAIEFLTQDDPVAASILLHRLVLTLLDLYFSIRGLWIPAPKQVLAVVESIDEDFYNLIIRFYDDSHGSEERIAIAGDIVKRVFLRD